MITVQDVLEHSSMKGKYHLVAGKNGLRHAVSWVHITEEFQNLSVQLSENFLVLSTGVCWTSPGSLLEVMKTMIQKDVAGLCIEISSHMLAIPPEAVEMADSYNFPLAIFPDMIRFADITQSVNKYIIEECQVANYHFNYPWLVGWVNGTATKSQVLAGLAKLGCFPTADSSITVLLSSINLKRKEDQPVIRTIQHYLNEYSLNSIPYIDQAQTIFIIISSEYSREQHFEIYDRLTNITEQFSSLGIKLGLGQTYPFDTPVMQAIDGAKLALGSIYRSSRVLADYSTMQISAICEYLLSNDPIFLHDFILCKLGALRESRYELLLDTLKVYFDCNCNKRQTAERLFLSRQSLYYRLTQIAEILGDDFDVAPRRAAIEFAVNSVYHEKNRNGQVSTNSSASPSPHTHG